MRLSDQDRNSRLFYELAADRAKVRAEANTVSCPLCLRDFSIETVEKLSVEHIISSKLGGTVRTLTCRKCNNSHGSRLDRHLISAMKAIDALAGHAPIATTWQNSEGHVAIDLFLGSGTESAPVTLNVVKRASNWAAVNAIYTQLFDGATLNLQLNFDFIPECYWRAAIRAAYLAIFNIQGYEYVFSNGASQVRSVLNSDTPVPQNVVMEAFPDSEPPGELLIMPHSFNDAGECFTVLLRLRSNRTRYLAVFLPGKAGSNWDLLGRLYAHAPRLRIETTPVDWTSKLLIYLGYDPVSEMREAKSFTDLRGRSKS